MMSPGRRGSRWDIEDGFLYGLQDRRGRLIPGRRRSSSSSENVEVEKAGSCRCFVGLSCAVAELVLGSFFAEVLDSASFLFGFQCRPFFFCHYPKEFHIH